MKGSSPLNIWLAWIIEMVRRFLTVALTIFQQCCLSCACNWWWECDYTWRWSIQPTLFCNVWGEANPVWENPRKEWVGGWWEGTQYNTIHAPLYPCAAVVGKTNFPSHYEECVAFIGQMLSEERMHVNMLTLAIEYRIFSAQGVNIQLSKKAKSSVICWEISPRKKSLGRRIIPWL